MIDSASRSKSVELKKPPERATVGSVDQPAAWMQRCWFAVYTKSHHEKSVARQMVQKSIEHYLPLHKSDRTWSNHRRVSLEIPLFPNYLFVHIVRSERSRVLATEGVMTILDRSDRFTPLPDLEIERLRAELHLRQFEPCPNVTAGRKCRIVAGPLAGLVGTMLRRKSDLRVVLTAPLVNQCVAIEVSADEIAPAETPDDLPSLWLPALSRRESYSKSA